MKILVLTAQRKCSYQGQYGVECLACMSEYEYDDNPDYLYEEENKYTKSDEFDAIKLITLEVDEKAILNVLFPKQDAIKATVSV